MREIKPSRVENLGDFGILNGDATREILSKLSSLDHPNVRLVCRSW